MNRYSYEDLSPGHKESFEVTVDEKAMELFKTITGDINPLHNDKEYALKRGYDNRVVYGMLTASYLSTLAGVYLPGERSLIQSTEVKFSRPVYPGEKLTIEGEVTEKNDAYKVIVLKVTIRNSKNEKVLKGRMQIGIVSSLL